MRRAPSTGAQGAPTWLTPPCTPRASTWGATQGLARAVLGSRRQLLSPARVIDTRRPRTAVATEELRQLPCPVRVIDPKATHAVVGVEELWLA